MSGFDARCDVRFAEGVHPFTVRFSFAIRERRRRVGHLTGKYNGVRPLTLTEITGVAPLLAFSRSGLPRPTLPSRSLLTSLRAPRPPGAPQTGPVTLQGWGPGAWGPRALLSGGGGWCGGSEGMREGVAGRVERACARSVGECGPGGTCGKRARAHASAEVSAARFRGANRVLASVKVCAQGRARGRGGGERGAGRAP
jgi:hypothetical protein